MVENIEPGISGAKPVIIPGGHGMAFKLTVGARATIALIEGPQVVDTWAFCLSDPNEYVSCEHTRSCLEKLRPGVGDALHSNRRRPLLSVEDDTSPGVHDLLLSACDAERYARLGHEGPHRTCADNFKEAIEALGYEPPRLPSPVNLFENVSIGSNGTLEILPPVARKGDALTLKVERDLCLVLSSCPMDIAATNGADRRVKPVSVSIIAPEGEFF